MNFDQKDFVKRMWYGTIGNKSEVDRIMNPTSAEDELLRIKAEAILDNARVYRVKSARYKSAKDQSMLFKENSELFESYISTLPDYERLMSESVAFDFVLAASSDSMCMDTDHGKVVIISECFAHFLYFMNLANLNFSGVSESVKFSARLIAVRAMLLSESLDFDLDPRGTIPSDIRSDLELMVFSQLQFLIGHELAHNYLNHEGSIIRGYQYSNGLAMSRSAASEWCVHSHSWEQEYAADRSAIEVPQCEESRRSTIFFGALHTLCYLQIFEQVAEYLNPEFSEINTHPPIKERYDLLVEEFGSSYDLKKELADEIFEKHILMADDIIEFSKENSTILTFYGSIYLAEWRGPDLRDRIDY